MPRGGRRQGAGRPKARRKPALSVTLSEEAEARLTKMAESAGTSKSAVVEAAILEKKFMRLVEKNDRLFAVDQDGKFIGQIVNEVSGFSRNPGNNDPGVFARVFSGHGYIYHQHDNPPNPFFIKSWAAVFENPELLPAGTKNVFIDQDDHAKTIFYSRPVASTTIKE